MSSDAQLYEETFTITSLATQPYDRVSRLIGTSTDATTSLTLDVNSELYPCQPNENVTLLLAQTLNLDGTIEDVQKKGWRPSGKNDSQTLADLWDYVCYGKVYRHEDKSDGGNIKVYISFGGLLCCLDGPYKKLSPLRIDNLYLLLKK
ncbi:DNA-directed RNA polymerases I, II, and III subunit RPABC3 [Recurvomyces mirabilis]|uniref:DNA-directed RNA polymerases I, II, and III subunit RPABC3 n=1 Tax=Recurvomyces mirabilis TaxID=574656 RepID=A0AAE0WUQ6_9PEZI|nr:DNA-directed RNA polymerases I, II, and III subunit RPABC3 [Recurvomyces mirabilis]KAK5160738.1 DEAH-box ATP-dependent RNA helicase prp22 [Recurvomyces mirabilis]